MYILEFLLLGGNGPEHPVALGLEEDLGGGVWDEVWNRDGNALHRVDTEADAAGAGALAERHLADFGVHEYFFSFFRHKYCAKIVDLLDFILIFAPAKPGNREAHN